MNELALAFGIVFLGVGLYAGWLGSRQRRLAQRIDELEAIINRQGDDNVSRAA